MNMNIMRKFQRFVRIRKLHTIISQETIKPSSPTPPHLKTHNLSIIDYLSPNVHMPFVFFYQNYNINSFDINILKKSLSQSLTQYYPFAGRLHSPSAPHIDCNDKGVDFVEASIHSPLDEFINKKHQDETFDQLIPNALGCAGNKTSSNMTAVQLTYFTCGGAAVSVSTSHKIGDAFTMANFINHWATLTRGGSPINPIFFYSSSISNLKKIFPDFQPVEEKPIVKYATKRFVFTNSKLNELKKKINAMGTSPVNPTRVESLTSLLSKTLAGTGAASTKLGVVQTVNLRGKTNAMLHESGLGNLYALVSARMKDLGEEELIRSLRKDRMELQGIRDLEDAGRKSLNVWVKLMEDQIPTCLVSSVCRFPFYEMDFGWGKPVRVLLRCGSMNINFLVLMDTPSGDGIEATVQLEQDQMLIFQKDEELHAYAQHI